MVSQFGSLGYTIMGKTLNDHGVGVFDWPANSPDLNLRESMEYCQEENEKQETKKCR